MSRHFDDVFFDEGYYLLEDGIWIPIPGYEDYLICKEGYIYSCYTNRILKPHRGDIQGHLNVRLSKDGKVHEEYIHRLVAKTFIPNNGKKPIVRHLDDDKENNHMDNLALGTQKDNHEDCVRNRTYKPFTDEDREKSYSLSRTPITAINLETGQKLYFISQAEASKVLGIQQANIWKVLNGERTKAQGYTFVYGGEHD